MEGLSSPGPWYEPFEARPAQRLIREVLGPIIDHYFRPRLIGADRIAESGPLILAPNHSGNAFPYDGVVLDVLLWRRDGMRPERKFRSMFDKELAHTWWMRPFGMDNFWRRGGGVDMTFDNFERLLARGERVIYYPEGVAGIGKGFNRRYQLQPFHTSFITLAARQRAPVHPVYIINAEWILPFSFTVGPLDRAMDRMFGVPFLPLPAAPLGIAFPWIWYLALPGRMFFVIGEPLDITAMVVEERPGATGLPDRAGMQRVAERARRIMQRDLDRYVARFGQRPYQARSLFRRLREAHRRRVLFRSLPIGWPSAFLGFDRDGHRDAARNAVHAVLRDWDVAGFYIPFGWPLLSITRALRRPPCGYRGLTPEQRRAREGAFTWRLAERPLPPK